MSGLSESKQTHVHLRNVDPATLQIIITYAYTGNLAISDSTVEPLYETACFLQVCVRQSMCSVCSRLFRVARSGKMKSESVTLFKRISNGRSPAQGTDSLKHAAIEKREEVETIVRSTQIRLVSQIGNDQCRYALVVMVTLW